MENDLRVVTKNLFEVTRARVRRSAVAAGATMMSPGNSASGTRSSVVTGTTSGGDRPSTQSPKRRMAWVRYAEIVACGVPKNLVAYAGQQVFMLSVRTR